MCEHNFNTPNGGIPITSDIHEKLPPDVQYAYEVFYKWWSQSGKRPKRSEMPTAVSEALVLIKQSPVPKHEGYTCADSCFIIGVEHSFVD